MKVFSKVKPDDDNKINSKSDNIIFSNDYVDIVDYEGWTIVKESDMVVCLVYFIEENRFLVRNEWIPTFKMVDGQEYHLTILSGTVESGETIERTLLRELEEEAGLVIRPDFKFEFYKPLFVSKGNTAKYHPIILTLTEVDYNEVIPKGDGSKAEKKSECLKLDIKYINSLNPSDLITDYMIGLFKKYLNL